MKVFFSDKYRNFIIENILKKIYIINFNKNNTDIGMNPCYQEKMVSKGSSKKWINLNKDF